MFCIDLGSLEVVLAIVPDWQSMDDRSKMVFAITRASLATCRLDNKLTAQMMNYVTSFIVQKCIKLFTWEWQGNLTTDGKTNSSGM